MVKMDNEALLLQLGYSVNDATKKQIDNIVKNTKNFEKIRTHIIALKDNLVPLNTFVGMSNSKDYFKIKIETNNEELISQAQELIQKWAKKYKVKLEQNGKVYYIKEVE